eukprot:CAMPEP_0170151558 /NCGR_PEP_ID=MMETSP0033_2-20121228/49950_1 /TAXON_ID=195969 /ORGANISM="Dolichomastix tenuilepis, Strain CCMP3274" /LENGTH=93 /DNA_ID=CAMNT_0010388657 /DNA_START=86 /DNA_END=367 /DNA_ORIENTATION=-
MSKRRTTGKPFRPLSIVPIAPSHLEHLELRDELRLLGFDSIERGCGAVPEAWDGLLPLDNPANHLFVGAQLLELLREGGDGVRLAAGAAAAEP